MNREYRDMIDLIDCYSEIVDNEEIKHLETFTDARDLIMEYD